MGRGVGGGWERLDGSWGAGGKLGGRGLGGSLEGGVGGGSGTARRVCDTTGSVCGALRLAIFVLLKQP